MAEWVSFIVVSLWLALVFGFGLYAGRYVWPYQSVKTRPVLGVLPEGRVECVLMDENEQVELSRMTVVKSNAPNVIRRGRGRHKEDRYEQVAERDGVLVYRRTGMTI